MPRATVPAPIAEGTEVLPPHAAGVTLAGAGGGFGAFCKSTESCSSQLGVGGEARVRLGLRGHQEIGVSGRFRRDRHVVVGGSLGLLVAPYTSEKGTELYTGARGSFGIPIFNGGSGATESVVVPVGFSFKSGSDVRVSFEGGLAVGFNQYRNAADPKSNLDATYLGGYGAVGVLLMVR